MKIKAKEEAPVVVEPGPVVYTPVEEPISEPVAAPVEAEPATTEKKRTTSKLIVWICLINGFLWVWCSYILAALDKVQIAESLSQVAVTEIIGVVLAYCIKSAIENLSKNNKWPDKSGGDPPGVG